LRKKFRKKALEEKNISYIFIDKKRLLVQLSVIFSIKISSIIVVGAYIISNNLLSISIKKIILTIIANNYIYKKKIFYDSCVTIYNNYYIHL